MIKFVNVAKVSFGAEKFTLLYVTLLHVTITGD